MHRKNAHLKVKKMTAVLVLNTRYLRLVRTSFKGHMHGWAVC